MWVLLTLAAAPTLGVCQTQTAALAASPQSSGGGHATASSTGTGAEDTEPLTMFPHSETAPWFAAGQTNIIFQAHPPFHSPYQGPNSFHGAGEYKTSLLGTLFLGYQPQHDTRYNTDFIVDFESSGGRGLSEALGLAGFTNLDVVRNPNLGSTPYLARGEIHQTIGLTNDTVDAERTPISLATKVPVRRFELRVGKMTMPDLFDINP